MKCKEMDFILTINNVNTNLKHSYSIIKDHNKKSKNDKKDFRHEEIFDDVFSKSHAINPVHVVESSVPYVPPTSSRNTSLDASKDIVDKENNYNDTMRMVILLSFVY